MAKLYYGDGYFEMVPASGFLANSFTVSSTYISSGNNFYLTKTGHGLPLADITSYVLVTFIGSGYSTDLPTVGTVASADANMLLLKNISGSIMPRGSVGIVRIHYHDWNTTSNWYSSLGNVVDIGCCYPSYVYTPGTLANTVPTSGDTVELIGGFWYRSSENVLDSFYLPTRILIPPSSSFSGTIFTSGRLNASVAAGTWNNLGGALNTTSYGPCIERTAIVNGTLNCNVSNEPVRGGTVNGAYHIRGNSTSGSIVCAPTTFAYAGVGTIAFAHILGGTFTDSSQVNLGQVWVNSGQFNGTVRRNNSGEIYGGNYSPVGTVAFSYPTGITTNSIPPDPGFGSSSSGGTYTPRLSITGLPGILGAGLP